MRLRTLMFSTIMMFSFPQIAMAQDIDGRDTASNWRGTHHEDFGIWNSICDEREETGILKQRCYIRWVDVYASRPKFGALFMFITPDNPEPRVEFGPEIGTSFLRNGFQIQHDGEPIWQMTRAQCLVFAQCVLTQAEARSFLEAMIKGDALTFSFVGPHDRKFDLNWSTAEFENALQDFREQSILRNLWGT